MPFSRLLIMRHAKSSWADPALEDHERPLNKRGQAAAAFMAAQLMARGLIPDAVLCSTALRTRQTIEPLLPRLSSQLYLHYLPRLYEGRPAEYRAEIDRAAAAFAGEILLLVGHNDTVQDLTLELAGNTGNGARLAVEQKFPTGAVAVFQRTEGSQYGLSDFLKPRDLMSD